VVLRGLADRQFGREKLARAVGFARGQVLFRSVQHGERLCALGDVTVENAGRFVVGDRVTFVGGMIPSRFTTHPGGVLEIGSNTSINYGSSFEAYAHVKLGSDCLVASLVRVCDRDGDRTAPIVIGDGVWLAHGAQLMPGVTIGRGSVVAAGSVVTRDIPPDMLAIGSPARAMKLSTVA